MKAIKLRLRLLDSSTRGPLKPGFQTQRERLWLLLYLHVFTGWQLRY
jgi:hypothetical protein